jgi:hypothetical protein
LLVLAWPAWADVPEHQQAEVAHLIDFVQNSDCRMIRNGTAHNGKEAAQHIRRKYDYHRKRISSTEDFIEYSATKSMLSTEYYEVECPGADVMKTQDWLLAELVRYRAR